MVCHNVCQKTHIFVEEVIIKSGDKQVVLLLIIIRKYFFTLIVRNKIKNPQNIDTFSVAFITANIVGCCLL